MKLYNLDIYFYDICGSKEDGSRVTKKEIIKFALEKNNINDLKNVVIVGDRMHDAIGGSSVGIDSISVLYGYGTIDEFRTVNPTYIAKDVNELENILLKFKE